MFGGQKYVLGGCGSICVHGPESVTSVFHFCFPAPVPVWSSPHIRISAMTDLHICCRRILIAGSSSCQLACARLARKPHSPTILRQPPLPRHKVAKILLMASYSSDKGDDHPISIKFHFCPRSISGCNTGPGRWRWAAR